MGHREDMRRLGEAVNDAAFGVPFRLVDGDIVTLDVSTPEVWHDEDEDIVIEGHDEWQAMTGMTGQYSYSGAVMHPSEYIDDHIADEMLRLSDDGETPTVWCVVVVGVLPDEDDEDPEPAGWAVLYRHA